MGLISSLFKKIGIIFSDIKLAHSVFALPFALLAAFLAKGGVPSLEEFGFILLAMVGARSGAMASNRLFDAGFDAVNPRTAGRALPSGKLKKAEMAVFIVASYAVFVFAASRLNRLCLLLSPAAIAWITFYSLTKRFTRLSHFVLGMSLAIAPMGAWLAIRGQFDLAPFFISAAVLLWVAGFDILYSFQDVEVDKKQGLFSIPSRFGIRDSLWLVRGLHCLSLLLLLAPYFLLKLGVFYLAGLAIAAALFVWEHSLVKPDDLSRLDMAFFNMNGYISISFFVFGMIDVLVKK
jgi:4-hydroxybenzoate polyprenyltransferase